MTSALLPLPSESSSSEASDHDEAANDGDEQDVDSAADSEFWEEDRAADEWLARYPAGIDLLYPQLFVVQPLESKVTTPSQESQASDGTDPFFPFFSLPSEIRNRIYGHYFDNLRDESDNLTPWNASPSHNRLMFRDRKGNIKERVIITSTNDELRFWLSTELLATSRQVRYEAMSNFFRNRVMTVDWLPALARFVDFMGKQGCDMVYYLDIWDFLNERGEGDGAVYRDIIANVMHFSRLQHLRIVLSWDEKNSHSWFDSDETTQGKPAKRALPKMRSEDVESRWPEYAVLTQLKAQKFTLAMEDKFGNRYSEFDRTHGAYPEVTRLMRTPSTTMPLASVSVTASPSSPQALKARTAIEPQSLEASEANETCSCTVTPGAELGDEESDSPIWQDTDALADNIIPLYNFVREYANGRHVYRRTEMSLKRFATFPTAKKSTGPIMRGCAFCYLGESHCGYHAVPDQPPFELNLRDEDTEEDMEILNTRFEDISYPDMRDACQDVVLWMASLRDFEWDKVRALFDYQGWFDMSNSTTIHLLEGVNKDEVPPWDMLYYVLRPASGNSWDRR